MSVTEFFPLHVEMELYTMIRSTTLTLLAILSMCLVSAATPVDGKTQPSNETANLQQTQAPAPIAVAEQPVDDSSSLYEELDRQEHLLERQKAQINILRHQVEELTRRLNAMSRT